MAAPSQPFPPWLTPLPTVVTDPAGILTTSTTVVYLPLTYYGPSIPLNSDWTYGGLTSPAPTTVPTVSIPTSSESTLVTTTSAIPPSSITTSATSTSTSSILTLTSTTSSTATPSSTSFSSISLSSSFTTSSSASSTSPSSTSTTSATPTSAASSGLSRGQLIGVIVASILGAVFLFILALALYLGCKGRKKRRSDVSFSIVTPIDEDYLVVGEEGRTLGEGSPRHSGEEADPFLQRSHAAAAVAASGRQATGTDAGARAGPSRVPVPPSGSQSSKGSSSTNHSGYGVLIDRPTLNLMPSTTEEIDQLRRGHILSPEELRRINEEEEMVLPPGNGRGRYSPPLPPPPRLVDPARSQTPPLERPLPKPQTSHHSQMTTTADTDEPVTVAIARRVWVEDISSRSPPQLPSPLADASSSTHSAFLAGLGAGLANIGRLSWLKSVDSNSRRHSRSHFYPVTPHEDIEAGKSLLHPQMSETTSSRGRSFGKNSDRTRPLSASSGGTVYHDARSSLPGTPISPAANLAPLPRALTPSGPTTPEHWMWKNTRSSSQPPPYDPLDTTMITTSTSASVFNHGLPVGQDILDLPAPSTVLPFTSASASGSTSTLSLREKDTTSSLVLKTHSFPPELVLGVQKSWTDVSSGATHVYAPFSVASNPPAQQDVSVDILEDAPPTAEEGWRSMAAVIQDGPGRRTTFGEYIPGPDIVSEQGSLYSMPSPLNPASIRSESSAPLSRRDQEYSTGSASSRPSALSAARSGNSLAASRSISSDERKRGQTVSPTLSAFGPAPGELETSIPSRPPTAYLNDGTVRSVGSGTTAVETLAGAELITTTASEPPGSPMSPSLQFSNAPWATGLDQDWNPTET